MSIFQKQNDRVLPVKTDWNSHTDISFFCDKCQIVPHHDDIALNRDILVLNRDTTVLNRDKIVLNCDNSAQVW